MELVAVDHVSPEYAEQVAAMLRDTGFHPRYDDLPTYSLDGASITRTMQPIYVPAEEADAARRVLAAYYDEANAGMQERINQLPKWWKGLGTPFAIAAGLALVTALGSGNFIYGLGVWLVSFIILIQIRQLLDSLRKPSS